MDIFSTEKRSAVMATIRNKGNRSTERRFAAMLRSKKISGWKLHNRSLPGRPDFCFAGRKVVVFVDGCFWHACHKCFRLPDNNREFWRRKIESNIVRDRRVNCQLRKMGFTVFRLWEHEIKRRDKRLLQLLESLRFGTLTAVRTNGLFRRCLKTARQSGRSAV
jgi:DNA mismatch endonuclease (patch repair protein)